ncbi:MAG: SCO family protein [Desulfopila sp.]
MIVRSFRIYTIVLVLCLYTVLSSTAIAADKKVVEEVVEDESAEQVSYKLGDPELDVAWIDEKSGEYIPLNAAFRDENGAPVTLGELIDRPTLILPNYFYCPSSCSLNLVNLATAIKRSRLEPGKDYKVIAFSFDEEEESEDARVAQRNYLRLLPKDFPKDNWKFLTGEKASIKAVTDSIGYTFKPLEDGTFIHPSALVAVAEDGMIIKYVYGGFATGDVDMAVTEAKSGTPAVSIKRFLGYCFNYDPSASHSLFQNLKLAVLAGFAVAGGLFFVYVRRTSRKKKGTKKGASRSNNT